MEVKPVKQEIIGKDQMKIDTKSYSVKKESSVEKVHQKQFKCEICNKIIIQYANFQRHIMMHNPNTELECKMCPKKFKHIQYLIAHEKRIHIGENKRFACELCGKVSVTILILKSI